MLRKSAHLLAVILLAATTVAAQADKTDLYVRDEMKRQRIPGLSIAVVRNGRVIKAKGYGMANVEHKIAATPETVYRIGSVSKQFIAAGIMILVDDGKLKLDDRISLYIEGTPETWKEISIRHLLSHTSGLRREAPGFNPFKTQTDADLIKTAFSSPLLFPTGSKWEYSNLGYFILSEIIRKASGKGLSEFMDERVFKPLGMSATRTTSLTDIVPGRASGYAWKGDSLENADFSLAFRPSGAFLSTVFDMARWDAALYTDKILKPPSRDEMWKVVAKTTRKSESGANSSYGLGWFIDDVNGHHVIYHGGSQPGFRAAFARYTDDKLSIIVLTNGDNANPDAIARGIAAFYIPGLGAKDNAPGRK